MLDLLTSIERRDRQITRWLPKRKAGNESQEVPPLTDWLPQVSPSYTWSWRHLRFVIENLNNITSGACRRLMIFLPPRHGKSELVTIRYPVYRIERSPETRVIIGAYNQVLANKFSRKARRIAQNRIELNSERYAVEEWETESGGGLRAIGVGGGITGQGADLIVIDDPVKSREEAESLAYRDRVWEWYTDDLYTRQEPGCAIILIMTRWHDDDLAGRILASEDAQNWTIVSLPAEAEENDPLGRKVGEALCPERFDLEALADMRRVLMRSYYALYQQRPRPREGDFFKRDWFTIVDAVPADAQRVRWWDKASTKDGGDYTAGVLVAYKGGIFYIEDVVRGQWAATERDERIRKTAEHDGRKYSSVIYWGEQEPGSAGKDAAAAFVRLLAGYPVHTELTSKAKEIYADPLASQAGAGNVKMLRAAWNPGFLDEVADFPNGKNDDQVEAAARAANKLAEFGGEAYGESVSAEQYRIGAGDY